MNKGDKVKVKSTQQVGTVVAVVDDVVLIYIYKRGTFVYSKTNLQPVERVPVSDCIDNSH